MENDKKIENNEFSNDKLDEKIQEQNVNALQSNFEQQEQQAELNNQPKNKRLKLFERLKNRKVANSTPEISKGKKNEYVHSNFKRKKEDEPDPSTFPKKKKILSWQEEELLMVSGVEYDQELADDIAEIAERKD